MGSSSHITQGSWKRRDEDLTNRLKSCNLFFPERTLETNDTEQLTLHIWHMIEIDISLLLFWWSGVVKIQLNYVRLL